MLFWMLIEWKMHISRTLMQLPLWLSGWQVMSFVTKVCDLFEMIRHYNKSHVTFMIKNSHLWLKYQSLICKFLVMVVILPIIPPTLASLSEDTKAWKRWLVGGANCAIWPNNLWKAKIGEFWVVVICGEVGWVL